MMIYAKGIFLLLIAVVVFTMAYRFFKKGESDRALAFIVLGGFILRGWCVANDNFLFAWDERYHALVAKNLADNPLLPVLFKTPLLDYDYRQWTINHIWLHKQPLSLWLMAASVKIFGATEWAIRLPSLLLSTLGIYLTYRIGSFFKDEKTGLLAAFFHAVNGLAIEIATGRQSTDHPDNIFFFFIELTVFFAIFYVKRTNVLFLILTGLATGLAILSKWLPALIVLPVFALLSFKQNGIFKTIVNCFIITIVTAAVALPWQLYIIRHFPQEAYWEYAANTQHLSVVFEGHDGSFWWHWANMFRVWNELFFLAFFWFLYKTYKESSETKWWALLCWILVPYLIFSVAATKMIAYPLFTAPAIFTVLAMFWWYLSEYPLPVRWISKLITVAIIVMAVRYGYERMWLFKDTSIYKVETARIKSWQPDSATVIFNLPERYIETMFYTSAVAAYPFVPTSQQIDVLKNQGYKIWIIKNGNISTELLQRNDVHFIQN